MQKMHNPPTRLVLYYQDKYNHEQKYKFYRTANIQPAINLT
jgi:hypothetical protein